MMTGYYELRGVEAPWGDYGDILLHGLIEEERDGEQTTRSVTRSGPLVPPITHPFGSILVTNDLREKLIAQRFSGLSFEPVKYQKVVRIAWEQWNSNAPEPAFYPDTGEPEYYLLEGTHDEQLAATMPRLWAWVVAPTKGLQVQGTNTFHKELHPGTDVAREYYITWIGERMMRWLGTNAGKWLRFVPVTPR
ncbi:MAG: hypothetical protein KDJ17_03265 [Hyphomicrobiaceae bacterium]|nr:hypothetical protein [Hyphomicrobiaceae bacterium]